MDLTKLHILSLMVSVRCFQVSFCKSEKNKIYLSSTELTISKPKYVQNKCYPMCLKRFLIPDDGIRTKEKTQKNIFLWCTSVQFLIRKSGKGKERKKSWNGFIFYYKFMQKPKISFIFIKCRNFYVFLINAICCGINCVVTFASSFNEKTNLQTSEGEEEKKQRKQEM